MYSQVEQIMSRNQAEGMNMQPSRGFVPMPAHRVLSSISTLGIAEHVRRRWQAFSPNFVHQNYLQQNPPNPQYIERAVAQARQLQAQRVDLNTYPYLQRVELASNHRGDEEVEWNGVQWVPLTNKSQAPQVDSRLEANLCSSGETQWDGVLRTPITENNQGAQLVSERRINPTQQQQQQQQHTLKMRVELYKRKVQRIAAAYDSWYAAAYLLQEPHGNETQQEVSAVDGLLAFGQKRKRPVVESSAASGVEAAAGNAKRVVVKDPRIVQSNHREHAHNFQHISVGSASSVESSGSSSSAQLVEQDICKHPSGCMRKRDRKMTGFCRKHREQMLGCEHGSGCEKIAVSKGLCTVHEGGKTCKHASVCHKKVASKGLCVAHGGGKRCTHDSGCPKQAQFMGFCAAHGGRKICAHESDCNRKVASKGLCIAHGGGKRCTDVSGCQKPARSKGLCVEHGGKFVCTHESGCWRHRVTRGLCITHGGRKRKGMVVDSREGGLD